MKFLPSTANSGLYGWEALLVTVAGALLPAAAVFIWAVFFRKRGPRKGRRRRRSHSNANSAIPRTNEASVGFNPESVPGESKS